MNEHLEAENVRLREEVDRLRAILYPPPPPVPDPEPERPRLYVIGADAKEEFARRGAENVRSMIQRQIPEADWFVAYRIEDMPEGAEGVLMLETLRQMWNEGGDKDIRWYKRKGEKLMRLYTPAQQERMFAESRASSRLSDRRVDRALRERFSRREYRLYRRQVNQARRERHEAKKGQVPPV